MNISELSKFRGGVSVDTISELTSASGVTIDGMLIKDGGTKVSNVINASGTAAIYSAGAWDFKNSSGTTTLAVSDAGAVTVGPASGTTAVQHTAYGYSDNNYALILQNRSTNIASLGMQIRTLVTSGTITGLVYADGANTTCGYVNIDTTANTVTYVNTSDARLKTNHRDFDGISLLKRMSPTKYERICNPGVDEIGLVAQDMQPIMPEAVSVGGEDAEIKPWGLDYGRITPILVKAIQEQQAMIEALTARLAALEAK